MAFGTPRLSVHTLQTRQRTRTVVGALVITAVSVIACVGLVKLPGTLSLGIAAIVLVPALLVWLWQQPIRGVYVLLGAAVAQESQFSGPNYADDLGRFVPFFQDITSWAHLSGMYFSVAELFMALVLAIWLLKGIGERTLHFQRGSLLLPLGLYMLMVLASEVHGLSSGGDYKLSLWEVRSQVYMLVAYVLACNLITTRRQVQVLVWVLLLGSGLKAVQGVWRYYVSLHGNLQSVESIFPHEQSFFFNAFLTLTPILFLYGGSRRLKRAALTLLPFVIVANLANQRRAALLSIAIALIALLVITAIVHPPRRRLASVILLVLVVLLPPYYLYYSGRGGLLSEPARAVSSTFSPDPRDASSNLYRVNEDKDILATMRSSPIIGYGFGKPMLTPYPLADISGIYIFWNIMPHDSILWIWMRLGTVGYMLFWLLIGTAIVQTVQLMRRLQDPFLKGLSVLIVLLVIQEVILGYLDLQWTAYRNLITVGVLFALIGRLRIWAREEEVASTPDDGLCATSSYNAAIRERTRDSRQHTRKEVASSALARRLSKDWHGIK